MSTTVLKFRLLDLTTGKIIRDSSAYDAGVRRDDGLGIVTVERDDVRVLKSSGYFTQDGTEIFDGDVVEAIVITDRGREPMTDEILWDGERWRFGIWETPVSELVLVHVQGNRFEMPWPTVPAA